MVLPTLLLAAIPACHRAPPGVAPAARPGPLPGAPWGPEPVAVDPPVTVRVGVRFGCVLRESGAVSCFGEVEHRSGRNEPPWTAVLGAVELGVGWDSWCTRDRAGAVRCGPAWSPYPNVVPLGAPADRLAVGGMSACARTGGEWWCWGGALQSELPTASGRSVEPVVIDALAGADQVLLGSTSCAIWTDGSARCWGEGPDSKRPIAVPWAPQVVGDDRACRGVDGRVECLTGCAPPPGSVLTRWPCELADAGPWVVEALAETDVTEARFATGRCVLDGGRTLSCTDSPFVPPHPVASGVRAFDLVGTTACWLDDAGVGCFGMPLAEPAGPPGPVALPFAPERLSQWGPYRTCAVAETAAACWGANHPVTPLPALAGCDRTLTEGYWGRQARCGGRWVALEARPPSGGLLPADVIAVAAPLVLRADGTAGRLSEEGIRPFDGVGGFVDVAGSSEVSGMVLLDRDGAVWRWSTGHQGEVGPVRVEGLPPIASIAAAHTLFLGIDTEGALWAWGQTSATRAEDDYTEASRAAALAHRPFDWPGPPPRQVLTDVASVTAGGDGVGLAIRGDGSGWCVAGESHDGAPCRRVDVRVGGLVLGQIHPGPLTGASVGDTAWCALAAGEVHCYGTGPQGTLGEAIPEAMQVQRIAL